MTCTLHVAWDERLADYDFGPGHPMAPVRLELTMELARAFGLVHRDGVSVEVPAAATRAELELYHCPGYIDVVRLAGSGRLLGPGKQDMTERVLLMHGLGTKDDPAFPGMHEAAAMVTGATLAAARAVWTSAAQHGASIAGGLHHAMAGNASGFCVYNDPVIAIAWLLGQGAGRPLDPGAATPGPWREYVSLVTGQTAPETMTEGAAGEFAPFDDGYNPADPVDQAILATRKAVFPLHGLMP